MHSTEKGLELASNPMSVIDACSLPVRHHQHRHNVKSRYEFLQTLGKGTYGKVRLARHKDTRQLVAVKAIRKDKMDESNMKHLRREMEIMASIQHENIIQIYEVFENQDKIVIVMEYASGGELYNYLESKRGISDEEAKVFFAQIVSAVRYCHKVGIVHRDLKLENILLSSDHKIKIADFGLANRFKPDSLLQTFCGSPLYASPEIVNGVPYVGPEVDSWSLGVLLYALVYGTMPFDGRDYQVLTKQITSGQFSTPERKSGAHSLIDWMLTVDPRKRASIDDIAEHEWLRDELGHRPWRAHGGDGESALHVLSEPSTPVCDRDGRVAKTSDVTNEPNFDPASIVPIFSPMPVCVRDEPLAKTSDANDEPNFDSPPPTVTNQTAIHVLTNTDSIVPIFSPINPQPRGILKRKDVGAPSGSSRPSPRSRNDTSEETLAGQLAAVCGLQAKDSLRLKAKPQTASGKRRVLRSKRDRESGYYSSPERVVHVPDLGIAASNSSDSTLHSNAPRAVPHIKSALASTGNQKCVSMRPKTSMLVARPPPGPGHPNPAKEFYLMPISPPANERHPSVSSDDASSIGSQTRPASTYSDSSILSSDSFDLCTFSNPLMAQHCPARTVSAPAEPHLSLEVPLPPNQKVPRQRPLSLSLVPDTLPPPSEPTIEDPLPSGALTPKSEKLVRDLQRILGSGGRRNGARAARNRTDQAGAPRPHSLDSSGASSLTSMMEQLTADLKLAYQKGLDVCVSVKTAEV